MNYSNAIEKRDISKIDKLNALTDRETFWNDVSKLTKRVSSDHSIGRWQCLAKVRYEELVRETEKSSKIVEKMLLTNNSRRMAGLPLWRKSNKRKAS